MLNSSIHPAQGVPVGLHFANGYLQRTSENVASRRIQTISTYIRLSEQENIETLYLHQTVGTGAAAGNNAQVYVSKGNATIHVNVTNAASGATRGVVTTPPALPSTQDIEWHHVMCVVDTTQAVDTDRVRVWWDFTEVTSKAAPPGGSGYFTLNQDLSWGTTDYTHYINSSPSPYIVLADYNHIINVADLTPDDLFITTADGGKRARRIRNGGTGSYRLTFQDLSNPGSGIYTAMPYSGNPFSGVHVAPPATIL